ncbi:pentapeptide repeat-containing protein [Vagococcus fluvialis]|uniref:pentapeptide repeat-containing protein n=1 Tax=Vagococcus fluvialis TaxID=2738 RepID=UPI003B5A5FD2
MPNFKIETPRIAHVLEETLPDYLEDEMMIKNQFIQDITYSSDSYQSLVFEKSHFKKFNVPSHTFNRFECVDCLFESCDFSNVEWIGAAFHRTVFKNCKLTGINFAESLLQNCEFIDCTINYASFNFAQLKRIVFTNCQLNESEFSEVKWNHLELEQCQLDKTNWVGTSLSKLNLSSCKFERLNLSPDLIRGFIVNYEQAITVGLTLGLVLDEPR